MQIIQFQNVMMTTARFVLMQKHARNVMLAITWMLENAHVSSFNHFQYSHTNYQNQQYQLNTVILLSPCKVKL